MFWHNRVESLQWQERGIDAFVLLAQDAVCQPKLDFPI